MGASRGLFMLKIGAPLRLVKRCNRVPDAVQREALAERCTTSGTVTSAQFCKVLGLQRTTKRCCAAPGTQSPLQHLLDGADQLAVDADHVAIGGKLQRGALLGRNGAALQDDATVAGQVNRRGGALLILPHQLDAELQRHQTFSTSRSRSGLKRNRGMASTSVPVTRITQALPGCSVE